MDRQSLSHQPAQARLKLFWWILSARSSFSWIRRGLVRLLFFDRVPPPISVAIPDLSLIPRLNRQLSTYLLALLCYGTCASPPCQAYEEKSADVPLIPAPSDSGGFDRPGVHRLYLTISSDGVSSLHAHPRIYARAHLRTTTQTIPDIGLHLKGSTGSFRDLDDKPSLTLDLHRFGGTQRFHGLRKFHLNNSVEDPSYLNECLGSELFRSAGVPAPRVAHAWVHLNGRSLGLYVLKEGFTEDFLARHFQRADGCLYSNDWGTDIDQRLKPVFDRDRAWEQAELKSLAIAALEPDLSQRWRQLSEQLDMNRFLIFMAMETMLGHRDGYCMARNNFRLYHDPATDKLQFLPHGMDQLLGTPDLPWQPHMAGLVARAVLDTPEGKIEYRACFSRLFTNLFRADILTNRVNTWVEQLRPALDRRAYLALAQAASQVNDRLIRRHASVQTQLNRPPQTALAFNDHSAPLTEWVKYDEPQGGKMDRIVTPDGLITLHIGAGPITSASWRTIVLLPQGKYRFEGRVRTAAVKPLPFGKHQGAGLRLGGHLPQSVYLTGDNSWQKLETEFQVTEMRGEIELIGELRASGGDFWLELNSLRVIKLF